MFFPLDRCSITQNGLAAVYKLRIDHIDPFQESKAGVNLINFVEIHEKTFWHYITFIFKKIISNTANIVSKPI
jgi:hypothetical protein